jgi:hypothetical protein
MSPDPSYVRGPGLPHLIEIGLNVTEILKLTQHYPKVRVFSAEMSI